MTADEASKCVHVRVLVEHEHLNQFTGPVVQVQSVDRVDDTVLVRVPFVGSQFWISASALEPVP
jgi:hypothetical protein